MWGFLSPLLSTNWRTGLPCGSNSSQAPPPRALGVQLTRQAPFSCSVGVLMETSCLGRKLSICSTLAADAAPTQNSRQLDNIAAARRALVMEVSFRGPFVVSHWSLVIRLEASD